MVSSVRHDSLEVVHLGEMTVVTFTDRSLLDDRVLQGLEEKFFRRAGLPGQQLLLNLGNVEHLTSRTLGKLITYHKTLEAAGGRLLLGNLSSVHRDIFQSTGLDKVFHLYEQDAALTDPQGERPAPAQPSTVPPPRSTPSDRPLVVLCDPRPRHLDRWVKMLPSEFTVVPVTDLEALRRCCAQDRPAAVALPLYWPPTLAASSRGNPTPALALLQTLGWHVAVVYADTHQVPAEVHCRALAAGATQLINEGSPTFADDVCTALTRLVHSQQVARQEQQDLARRFAEQGMVGHSPAMQEVFRRALKASLLSDAPVLLLGETGTGKQRMAEAIHQLDPQRCHQPFVTLNCSALSKTLAESELFGHTKGAFSGAERARLGVFRAANGGTLLLDEVGELDRDLQPKLLRVLQERRLLPVGADYEHAVDVRIIAATNRPLAQMVAVGTFRQDLYQRLKGLQIHLPPLRERPEDIAVQARYFLQAAPPLRRRAVQDFTAGVLDAFRLFPWEGNSRQLEHCVREILAHKDSGTLVQMEDLPRWVLESLVHYAPPAQGGESRREPAGAIDPLEALVARACQQKLTLEQALAEYERRLVQAALEQNHGNRTRTAAHLGVTPRSVFNKLRRYGLG